ncbi:MAG TPA: PTS transporter subunit EIIC [Armatimonadota bacterium]|nr:PTS transporter subunit EIIC [Armatimonadota bacterium]
MSKFFARIEKPLMSVADKLGQQPHLNAIRDGVVGALPLILIGSIFMLVAQPPLPSKAALDAYAAHPFVGQLLIGFQMLVGLVGLYVAFGVAHSLAKRYNLDALSAGLLSVAALLMTNGMQAIVPPGAEKAVKFIPMMNLGSGGLFMALILGLLVPEVQRLARKYKLEITMPDGVPPAVGRSFSALIPGIIILMPLWAIVHLFGIDLFNIINTVLTKPIMAMSTSGTTGFVVMLAIILVDSVLWLLGVHAVAILAPMSIVWLNNITANAGGAHHLLNTRESFQFFIWLGGSGATIVLPFLLLRAKAASLRAIAKVGAVPALFNINEPLIFGVPVMMNATLAIPFVLAPLTALTTTVLATHFGLVPVPSLVVPWTLPGPIGAFFATGGSWQAAVLSAVNIALAGLIYWPFVRALDRKVTAQEQPQEPTTPAVA